MHEEFYIDGIPISQLATENAEKNMSQTEKDAFDQIPFLLEFWLDDPDSTGDWWLYEVSSDILSKEEKKALALFKKSLL